MERVNVWLMGTAAKIIQVELPDNEMKLRKKHLVRRPSNKGINKRKHSGGAGRRARALARARAVSQRNSPEQWGRYKAWAASVGEPMLG